MDARVTNDANKTFLLGTDIMLGSSDHHMLPWKLDLSGRCEIGLRRQDLPWTVFVHMKVPEEYTYSPCWDDKDWNPRRKPKKVTGGVHFTTSTLPPPPSKPSSSTAATHGSKPTSSETKKTFKRQAEWKKD